jgi:four helix bundle protein
MQNANCKMQNQRENLSDRLLNFSASIVGLTLLLNKTLAGRHIAGQILRSSTSCGANYEEACAAESRADFIHKMQIVLKELRETLYWLKLAAKCFPNLTEHLRADLKEADELIRIFSKSVVTAKNSGR